MPKQPLTIALNEREFQMLDEVKEELGESYRTGALTHALKMTHRKLFPTYAVKRGGTMPGSETLSTEDRARQKLEFDQEQKKQKEQAIEDQQSQICYALGGDVQEDNGRKYCHWTQHGIQRDYPQKVHIHSLTNDNTYRKFMEGEELVLRERKDLHKKYPDLVKKHGIKKKK